MMRNFERLIKFNVLDGGGGDIGGDAGAGAVADVIPDNTPYDYGTMVGEGGAFSENWKQGLSEDLRGDTTLASLTDVNQMAKMLVHSQRMMGKDKIVLPNENSSDDDWNEFYTKSGRPETFDKYDINTDGIPADLKEMVEGDMDWYKETSFKHGLSEKQSQALFNDFQEHNTAKVADMRAMQASQQQAKLDGLKTEWGAEYEKNAQLANQALTASGMREELLEAGLGDNPTVIKLLNHYGSVTGEDTLSTGAGGGGNDSVQEQINAMRADTDSPYYHKDNPRHSEYVNRMASLYTQLG